MTKKIWKIWALRGALIFTFLGLSLGNVQAKALTGVVNLNTATPAQLILLPGIGKAKARVIMEKRQAKPFANFQDLEALPGLGKKRLAALKPHVVFTGPTTAKNIRPKKKSTLTQHPNPSTPPGSTPVSK